MSSRVPVRLVSQGSSTVQQAISVKSSAQPLEQTSDRQVNQLQRHVAKAIERARGNVIGDHVVITALTFTAGETKTLSHKLGQAYAGFFCVRAQSKAPALYEVALPTGVSSKQAIAIKSDNAGTYDVMVFT